MKLIAKKSLGQHFLFNPTTIDKILRLAQVGPADSILEIGPGLGIMTEQLVRRAKQVVAIEKDRNLVSTLKEKFHVIEGDILEIDLEKLLPPSPNGWKVVANLPYNIATRIILNLLEQRHLFSSFYLMIQKEVAERLVAQPGFKTYGSLSIMAQIFSRNKIVMRLPPGAFTPPPRVDSAVVEFKIKAEGLYPIRDLEKFEKLIRQAFSQRRKMMVNNIPQAKDFFGEAGIPLNARAEQMPIEKFVRLANLMK